MANVAAKYWLLGILAVISTTAFISGVVARGSVGTQTSIYVISTWPVYLLTYAWMKADARAKASTPPPGAIPLILVLLPIAVVYYLLATRLRWRKILALCCLTGYIGIAIAFANLGDAVGRWLAT